MIKGKGQQWETPCVPTAGKLNSPEESPEFLIINDCSMLAGGWFNRQTKATIKLCKFSALLMPENTVFLFPPENTVLIGAIFLMDKFMQR